MNIKCPNCGAVHSLDTLINDADASAVFKAVLDMDAELGKAAIRYIGLFRPAKSQLSWSRTAKLLNELMPSIKAATVERDGVNSKGEKQYISKGQINGTLITGETGIYNFTCTAVYHQDSGLYEAWSTIEHK